MNTSLSFLSKGRVNNFNLIRMLAAIGVLISHSFPLTLGRGAGDLISNSFGVSIGTICLYVFFVLSGFFITKSFEQRKSSMQFIFSRFLRIFPALAVCLLIIIIAGMFLTKVNLSLYLIEATGYFSWNFTLFYGQTSLPGVFGGNIYSSTINGSLWTLNFELLCYIITFIIGLSGVLKNPFYFVSFFIISLMVYFFSFQYKFPDRITLLLLLGIPYLVGSTYWVFRNNIIISNLYAMISLLMFSTFFYLKAPYIFWLPFFAYLLFFLGHINFSWLLVYNKIGDYSYGIYIYAFPVQQFFVYLGTSSPFINILCSLPVALVFATFSWHIVEKPAFCWKILDKVKS